MGIELEDLTVGLLTYRRPDVLAETLKTLADIPNLMVMMNGSGMDEYATVVGENLSRVKFIHNPRNLGVAAAENRLITESDTRYVVLSTDSADFSDGWYRPVLELLNSDSRPDQMTLGSPKRFTAVLFDKEVIGAQGFHDHNYTQVYYEDEDMYLRSLERLGMHGRRVDQDEVMSVLSVVTSRSSAKKTWNSIPNRHYFWRKWERVDETTPDYLHLLGDVFVRRRLPEPTFPYLDMVQERYRAGDYSAIPFIFDPPSRRQIMITRLTTNVVVTRARYFASRLTNPTGDIK